MLLYVLEYNNGEQYDDFSHELLGVFDSEEKRKDAMEAFKVKHPALFRNDGFFETYEMEINIIPGM